VGRHVRVLGLCFEQSFSHQLDSFGGKSNSLSGSE
jgi:hypothetical protein